MTTFTGKFFGEFRILLDDRRVFRARFGFFKDILSIQRTSFGGSLNHLTLIPESDRTCAPYENFWTFAESDVNNLLKEIPEY